jgi:hypothetical protein
VHDERRRIVLRAPLCSAPRPDGVAPSPTIRNAYSHAPLRPHAPYTTCRSMRAPHRARHPSAVPHRATYHTTARVQHAKQRITRRCATGRAARFRGMISCKDAKCNVEHATCNDATCNKRRAAMQHAKRDVQRCNMQRAPKRPCSVHQCSTHDTEGTLGFDAKRRNTTRAGAACSLRRIL